MTKYFNSSKATTKTTATTAKVTTTGKVTTIKKETAPAIDLDMQRQIMAQVVDYKFGPQDEYVKPATYIVAANGTYCVKKTSFGTITVPVKEVPYLKEMDKGFNLNVPKAPYNLFLQAYSFFKDVTLKSGDEAALVLYWNKSTNAYEYLCPEQSVSGAAVKFGDCAEYLRRMHDPNYARVCELHSHNSMSAFHSGTDDNDEVFDCSFLVFGRLNTASPEHIFSYAASGVRIDSNLWDLFEAPKTKLDLGNGVVIEESITTPLFFDVEYPADWHDKLHKHVYTYKYGAYKNSGTTTGKTYIATNGKTYKSIDEYYDEVYDDEIYGYGGYEGYGSTHKITSATDKDDITKEVSKLTGSSYLGKIDDQSDDFDQDVDNIIDEMEGIYGTLKLDEIADALYKKKYGSSYIYGY